MDLFKDIKKGKFGNNPKLKHEAKHELKELGGENHAEKVEEAVEKKGYRFGNEHNSEYEKAQHNKTKKKEVAKKMPSKNGFDYHGMMRDVHKHFPNVKIDGKSPYAEKHKK